MVLRGAAAGNRFLQVSLDRQREQRRAAQSGRRRTRADQRASFRDPRHLRRVKRQTMGMIERSEAILAQLSGEQRTEVRADLRKIRRSLQTRWTPIDTGHLRRSIQVGLTPTGIVARWRTRYAIYVNKYYENFVRRAMLRLPGVKRVQTRASKTTGWVTAYGYY